MPVGVETVAGMEGEGRHNEASMVRKAVNC